MQRNLAFYVFISLLFCGVFLTLTPYPTFYTGSYNLSQKDISKINQANEVENYSFMSPSENSSVLNKLGWFECVNMLMPYHKAMKIIDVKSGTTFSVNRVGGTLHADVTPSSEEDKQILNTLIGFDISQKRPVVIELQTRIWSSASLSCKELDSDGHGHFCLYFDGSKSHATGMKDVAHQKSVDYAFKHGKNLIN